MQEIEQKTKQLLGELHETIESFLAIGQIDHAELLLEQLIKLFPYSKERYKLEAKKNLQKKEFQKTEEVLMEGISRYPLDSDLLLSLGKIRQKKEDYFNAYNSYMKALYVAEDQSKRTEIASSLKSLLGFFKSEVFFKEDSFYIILGDGKKQLTIVQELDSLKERKEILDCIRGYLDGTCENILEIGFEEGAIGKNLNYFGYDVTAVDRSNQKILQVIAREWHDNILHAGQKTARFYQENVNLEWLHKIDDFDIIIAIADQSLEKFASNKEEAPFLLEQLLVKAKSQLFIKVTEEEKENEFSEALLKTKAVEPNFAMKEIWRGNEGQKIFLVEKKRDRSYFQIPIAAEVLNSKSSVLNIKIEKCRDQYASSYYNDFHPFVETLKEYEKNKELKYEDSVLKDFYDNFQPRNSEEALFVKKGRAPGLRKGWIGNPWVFTKERKIIFTEARGETRPGGNHFHGPNTIAFGQEELSRLKINYENLKFFGYLPEMFADGYITGYLLLKGNDYRFVITEGQHRIAALAALGYNEIVCRLDQRDERPQIVEFKDIRNWPQVANGVFNRPLAEKIFNRYFDDGVGRDKMRS